MVSLANGLLMTATNGFEDVIILIPLTTRTCIKNPISWLRAGSSDVRNILRKIFRKISGNFLLNRKNVFIQNVSMKTAENTGKRLHSFKS